MIKQFIAHSIAEVIINNIYNSINNNFIKPLIPISYLKFRFVDVKPLSAFKTSFTISSNPLNNNLFFDEYTKFNNIQQNQIRQMAINDLNHSKTLIPYSMRNK